MLISELVTTAVSNLGIINSLSLLSLLFLFRHTPLPSTRTCGVRPPRHTVSFLRLPYMDGMGTFFAEFEFLSRHYFHIQVGAVM